MKAVHRRIVEKIESGEYISELKDVYGSNLSCLGFWGTEPTLTLSKVQTILPQLFAEFPKLKDISWSSNFVTNPKTTIDFIKALPKDREMNIRVQISLDGPTEITDKNRQEGVTAIIVKNIGVFAEQIAQVDLGKVVVEVVSKPTWDAANVEYYIADKERLISYYRFFDPLVDELVKAAKVNRQVRANFGSGFSLVVPGMYTKKDGQNLSKLFTMFYELEPECEKLFKYTRGGLNTYEHRLERAFSYESELVSKGSMFTCSGGDSNFAIDEKGHIHICHRSLFLNNAKYVSEVMGQNDIGKWGVSQFDQGSVDIVAKKFVVDSKNQAEIDRFSFVLGGFHEMTMLKWNYTIAMLKELIRAKQINECYEDESLAFLFGVFHNIGLSCPMENVLNTGNVHLQPVSIFRLFCNGAFEQLSQSLLRKMKDRRDAFLCKA